jgi:hypothetical protein
MRETRRVRRGRCRNDNTFRDFYFATSELIFWDYRYFQKLSKHMVSTPTSPLPPDNHPSRRNMSFRCPHPPSLTTTAMTPAPYTVPSNLRPCDWLNAPAQPPLALNELAGVRVMLGMYTLGIRTGGWFVDVRIEELTLLLCSKLLR